MRTAKTYAIMLYLFIIMTACHADSPQENIIKVKQSSLENFIYLQGGTFTMGDFGVEKNGRHLRLSLKDNTQPHQVTLTSFSLARYKVTWFDYDTYLLITGKPIQQMVNYGDPMEVQYWDGKRQPYQQTKDGNEQWSANPYYEKNPASVQWQDAKDYCQWLGQQLNLPIDLPTEAQWEYAARSGGYKVLYANAQGDIHNPPTERNFSDDPKVISYATRFVPVGTLSTPNAAGFYDMDNNGWEWVHDWYSQTYSSDAQSITNPQGPENGSLTFKSSRVWGATFDRAAMYPHAFITFRCAVNSEKSLQ